MHPDGTARAPQAGVGRAEGAVGAAPAVDTGRGRGNGEVRGGLLTVIDRDLASAGR